MCLLREGHGLYNWDLQASFWNGARSAIELLVDSLINRYVLVNPKPNRTRPRNYDEHV